MNAFWIACLYGHSEIMSILAEKGIDVMSTNKEQINALHLAAEHNYVDIVK